VGQPFWLKGPFILRRRHLKSPTFKIIFKIRKIFECWRLQMTSSFIRRQKVNRDYGECLTDETLTEYLEGGLDPAVKAASEVHLVACEGCRSQLAFFMHVLRPEVTPEEANALESIAANWDKKTANKRVPERRSFPRFLVALTAIAAVLVIGLLSAWIIRQRSAEPKSAHEVVQLLLMQTRPFESRMAEQPHRPIVRTRGSGDPGVSFPLLAGEMTRLSANSHEMGRFYLLQKDFERAVSYLEIAERETGAGAAVHNDLGVAYLERGDRSSLDKAEEEFLHALQQDKSFAAAAFNLALFYEHTNSTSQAEAQWKRYLELDSKSDWAIEARGRLQGLNH
jgi:tetratricopeptide (TPR) repeat protein